MRQPRGLFLLRATGSAGRRDTTSAPNAVCPRHQGERVAGGRVLRPRCGTICRTPLRHATVSAWRALQGLPCASLEPAPNCLREESHQPCSFPLNGTPRAPLSRSLSVDGTRVPLEPGFEPGLWDSSNFGWPWELWPWPPGWSCANTGRPPALFLHGGPPRQRKGVATCVHVRPVSCDLRQSRRRATPSTGAPFASVRSRRRGHLGLCQVQCRRATGPGVPVF